MEEATAGMRFAPKDTKNISFCSVYGCSSRADKDLSIRFHRFPSSGKVLINIINKYGDSEEVDKLFAWKKCLRMDKNVTKSMRVCSLHFSIDGYHLPGKKICTNYIINKYNEIENIIR